MKFLSTQNECAHSIRALARLARSRLARGNAAWKDASLRAAKPMDYLRCMEFPLAFGQLDLAPGMKLLDIASPQWFSILLAHRMPDLEITYLNILEEELEPIREIARALALPNLKVRKGDVRALEFRNAVFDRALSISTIEHIDPAEGGDVSALKEIRRVLKPRGEFTLSVPLQRERSLVYDEVHAVWEKASGKRNFYLRNYDPAQFEALVRDTGFAQREMRLMHERPGWLALDYWENGPGKIRNEKNRSMWVKKKIDKFLRLRLEGFLAARYLRAEENGPETRLINLVATLGTPGTCT